MRLLHVNDLEQPELSIYRTLRDNATTAQNSFIADSPKVVNIILQTSLHVHSILATPEYYENNKALIESRAIERLYVASKELMQSIVGHKLHHNVMLHGVRPDTTPLEALGDQIIMLDHFSKHENVGTVIRSAVGLGVRSLVTSSHAPHPYGRRALRVSMGYVSKMHYYMYDEIIPTIVSLRQLGYRILAAEVTPDATSLMQLQIPKKWVLLMGNEGEGISKEVLALCDETVTIEMCEDVKSFNVAAAASILMHRLING